jgi:hypothetical protein
VRFKTQTLPAGKLTVVKADVSASDMRRLRRGLHGRRGLLAELRVTAGTADSAPTVVSKRYQVSG